MEITLTLSSAVEGEGIIPAHPDISTGKG